MIYASAHLPADPTQDARPALTALLAANPGETIVIDGEWILRSRQERLHVLVLSSGQRLVGPGRLEYVRALDPNPADTIRMIGARANATDIGLMGGLRLVHRSGRLDKEQNHCVFIYGGQSRVTIEDVRVDLAEGGDGFYFGNGTRDVRVERCHVQDHARSAFTVAGYGAGRGNFLFRNCTQDWTEGFAHPNGRLVDFETQDGDVIQNVEIVACSGPGGIETHLANGVIRGCSSWYQIHTRTKGLLIVGNVMMENRLNVAGMRFIREQNCEVVGNVIGSETGHGITVGVGTGGLPWLTLDPDAKLIGRDNHALLGNPIRLPISRSAAQAGGRDPADSLEAPKLWRQP